MKIAKKQQKKNEAEKKNKKMKIAKNLAHAGLEPATFVTN